MEVLPEQYRLKIIHTVFSPAKLVVAVIALVLSSACNGRDKEMKHDITVSGTTFAMDSALVSRAYPMTNVNAGPFMLDAVIQDKMDGFEVEKSTVCKTLSDGAEIGIPVYTYYIGNEGWVRITPQYDTVTGQARNNIGEIYVYSELFLTDKCIGAVSSLEEFASVYPDISIRYIDEDDMFAIVTSQLPNLQFLLEREHYIGTDHDSDSSARRKLNVSDFKESSRFCAIRICRQ